MLHKPHEGNVIAARGRVCVCKTELEGDAVVCVQIFSENQVKMLQRHKQNADRM